MTINAWIGRRIPVGRSGKIGEQRVAEAVQSKPEQRSRLAIEAFQQLLRGEDPGSGSAGLDPRGLVDLVPESVHLGAATAANTGSSGRGQVVSTLTAGF